MCRTVCERWLDDRRNSAVSDRQCRKRPRVEPEAQGSMDDSMPPGGACISDNFVAGAMRLVVQREHATSIDELLQLPVQALLLTVSACRCAGLLSAKDLRVAGSVRSVETTTPEGSPSDSLKPALASSGCVEGLKGEHESSESSDLGSLLSSDSDSDSDPESRPARSAASNGATCASSHASIRSVRIRRLRRAHSQVCTKFLLSPVARAEFPDLLGRLAETGVLRIESAPLEARHRRGARRRLLGRGSRGVTASNRHRKGGGTGGWLHGPSGSTGGGWSDDRCVAVLLSRDAAKELAQ